MNLNATPEEFDLNAEDPIYIFAGLSLKEMRNLKQVGLHTDAAERTVKTLSTHLII